MSIKFSCIFKRETANAVLIVDAESGEEIWFPLSQVDKMFHAAPVDGIDRGTITVTDWIAKEKGLI